MTFAIYTDGCSNLPKSLLERLNIRILPFHYMVNGEPMTYHGDIDSFDAHAYYDSMRSGAMITTTLLNADSFAAHFRKALQEGLDVLYVGMSSGVSGTYQAARIAAEELQEEFPGRKVLSVDSLGAGLGVGLLTCLGADLRAMGKKLEEVKAILDEKVMELCQFFTVESLTYLHRSGRISKATYALGSVLDIKPLLRGDEEGHIVSCAKCRGRKKAIAAILDMYRTKAVEPEKNRVFISHGDCPEEAAALAAQVRAIAEPKELIVLPHEPTTGAHVGPGMLALFFLGDHR